MAESKQNLTKNHNRSFAGSSIEANLMSNKKNMQALENDKILLSNRIVMLQKEEERLFKKIQGTKEKADKIIEIKQRNHQKFQQKMEFEELEKLRVDQERERHREERERRKRDFEMQQKATIESKRQVFLDFKHQKAYAINHKFKVKMNGIKINRKKRDIVRDEENKLQMLARN